MTYKPQQRKWDWRAQLTPDEAAQVKALEYDIANYRKFMAEDAAALSPIRNRAIHRAKRAHHLKESVKP